MLPNHRNNSGGGRGANVWSRGWFIDGHSLPGDQDLLAAADAWSASWRVLFVGTSDLIIITRCWLVCHPVMLQSLRVSRETRLPPVPVG